MINSVNSIPMAQNLQMANGINSNNNPVVITNNGMVQNPNLNGANALASYNQPAKTSQKVIQPLLPTILQPVAIKGLQGERVRSAMGNLEYIVDKNDKTTTIYKMDIQAPEDAITRIECYDNKTGNLIRRQENFNVIEQGKMPQVILTEVAQFDPISGNITDYTVYHKGEVDCVKSFEYLQNGDTKEYTVTDGGSSLIEKSGNSPVEKVVTFDKSGKTTEVVTLNRELETSQTVEYQNGIPAKIKDTTKTPIVNTTGKNPQADPDIVPSQPYILGYNPKSVQGDRKYYSNGKLEAINANTENGFISYRFNMTNDLGGILDAQNPEKPKMVLFDTTGDGKRYTSVEEEITKGVSKTTIFNEDGTVEVSVMDRNAKVEKYAGYSKNGVMKTYIEYKENDQNAENVMMKFNNNGQLVEIA